MWPQNAQTNLSCHSCLVLSWKFFRTKATIAQAIKSYGLTKRTHSCRGRLTYQNSTVRMRIADQFRLCDSAAAWIKKHFRAGQQRRKQAHRQTERVKSGSADVKTVIGGEIPLIVLSARRSPECFMAITTRFGCPSEPGKRMIAASSGCCLPAPVRRREGGQKSQLVGGCDVRFKSSG